MKKYTQLLAISLLVTGFSINGFSMKDKSMSDPGVTLPCGQLSAGRATENPSAAFKSPFEAKYIAKKSSAITASKSETNFVPADLSSGRQQ